MNKRILATAVAGAVGATLYSATPTFAQGLEEVVVTARKRVETVQDTPVSVRAISAERIQRFDLTNLEKVAAMSPEFSVGRASNGSGAQLVMRGIGSSSTSVGIEQSVAVVVDEVYYGQGRIINEGMFDLERIELLKGPQALFFGKNATAGVVSMTTASPTEELEITGRVSHEFEAQQTTVEGIVSGPLTDTVGARLALRASRMSDGYFNNKAGPVTYTTVDAATGAATVHDALPNESALPQEDEFMGRLTLTADPTDRLSMDLRLSGTRSENENPSYNYTVYDCVDGVSSLNPAVPCGNRFDTYQNNMPAALGQTLPFASSSGKLGNEYRSWQVTGRINYEFDNFTLTSVTNWQENKNTFICACDFQSSDIGTWATEESTWWAFSEELRLMSEFEGPFNFMLGALYQKTEREFEQYIAFASAENSAVPDPRLRYAAVTKDSDTDGETISPFFQAMWEITPDVELSVGARYTRETKKSSFVQPYVNPGLAGLFREGDVARASQTFREWSPEATINWYVNPDVMLYAAYKTAYKSGGFSNSGLFSQFGVDSDFVFQEETAEGFEMGAKTTLMDNQLRFNVTAYYYEYDDLQVDFFNSDTFAFITLNAGSAETKGVEIDTEYAPRQLPGLTLTGALNYNKAEYDDFIAPCWSGQTQGQGCNVVVPGTVAPGQDISGAPTAMAPEWTASLGLDYQAILDNGMTAGFNVNAQYVDDHNPSAFDNPLAKRSSYTKWDASLYLAGPRDRWEVALVGKNLTDKHIVTGVVDGPSTGTPPGGVTGVPADQIGHTALPRTVALQLTGRF